jgi:hypothetical protein
MYQLPTFIDFEASSLGSASYPIEVAWNMPDGSIVEYLISPAGIESWTDWSPAAEKMHGISRPDLIESGKSSSWVCRLMNQQLAGKIAYSDNPEYDSMWLSELFARSFAGIPPVFVRNIEDLLLGLLVPRIGREQAPSKIAIIKKVARQLVVGCHRAAKDVEYLMMVYKLTQENLERA